MVVAMTRPQTPPEKKVDIFLVGGFAQEEVLDALGTKILEDFPKLLEINFTNIVLEGDPQLELAGRQKLMVMLGSQTGDIFVFSHDEFEMLARQGAFLPLDGLMDDIIEAKIPHEEMDEYRIAVEDEEGRESEPRIYGLPLKETVVFDDAFFDVENKIIAVMAYSRNAENAVDVIRWLVSKE
jgi:maltose-binding protein MalE